MTSENQSNNTEESSVELTKTDERPVIDGHKLTLKQELFCRLYATDARFFGNATQAYIEAYDKDMSMPGAYQTAKVVASENLAKPYLVKYINSLLEDIGFTDVEVDKQLAFLIAQHSNYPAKIAAIKEYNALKKRVGTGAFGGQVNIINLILQKWGLTDVGQNPGDETRVSEG